MPYVYRHIRLDKNEPFYVGIGNSEKRAYEKRGRSKFWRDVAKFGYEVEIIMEVSNWEKACEKEREFIKLYGRKDNKTGTLVNMTDGGDGATGIIITEERRRKMSKANAGVNNPMHGVRLDQAILDTISKKQKGKTIINNKKINKLVDKGEVDYYISIGWTKGRHEKNKQSNKLSRLGKKQSKETKNKISDSLKGKSHKDNRKVLQCPHCFKSGISSNMTRYHFNNCKYINNGV